jgi:D-glycero-D-manno-heptose 1,7-bisphosphate phosphatase
MLAEKNPKAVIDRHEFCPFHPDASIEKYRQNSALRKPSPGMIHSAAEALALDLERSWVIGDAPRDIEAGHAAGCRTILFTDPSLKSSPAALVNTTVEPDYVCSTLTEAMDYIEKNTERPAAEEPPPSPPPPPAAPSPAAPAAQPEPPAPTSSIAKVLAQSQPHSTARLESLVNELVQEIRRQREVPHNDFSVSKLMAGVTQILVLAILFMAFLGRGDLKSLVPLEIFALTLQTMTISLLIMGRQK